MITTNRNNLVKEGYLDIKVPPGNRERKLWKAWQKRWVVSRIVEEPSGLELRIYGCQKPSNSQSLWTVFISSESGKLYRSRSRTHVCAFSIANAATVVLHLAGESEQISQSWMAAMRDAIWPPSPLVQLEEAFQDVHRVSLIDDEKTCHSDLFAAYGHLYIAGDSILLMSTHSGILIKQWHLSEVQGVKLERVDEGKSSGVFSITLQNGPLHLLNFYSRTADSVVQNISSALEKRQEGKAARSSTLKYDSGIEELSELLSLESEGCDSFNSFDSDTWSLKEPSRNLATLSGDFLNCSVNSVFIRQDFSNVSRTSSDASSDYSPPVSPTNRTSPKQDGSPEQVRQTSDFLDYYYDDISTNVGLNSPEGNGSEYALIVHRASTCSGIYEDIRSLPPSKRPSLAETLYEDMEEEEGFIKLMDEIMEDEYLPPLPPPRNANNTESHAIERFTNTAKRPSTLGLENLSSSISETLSQIQGQPEQKTTKKNFPVGLFKPIKGVKRILSTKKNAKLSSPSKENSNNSVLTKQQLTPEVKEPGTDPLLIVHNTDSHDTQLNVSSSEFLTPESISSSAKNLPSHISDEHFVPFPELLNASVDCISEQQDEVKRKNSLSTDSSVVLREGQRDKETRSRDSLLVESLKSKHSCHRQFLEFLQVAKNNVNNDALLHVSQQQCIHRSISLDQLPCKSSHCRLHSTISNDTFRYTLIENFRNELQGTADLKTNMKAPMLKDLLSRRRSSDYCFMSSVVSPNSEEFERYVAVCDKNIEQKVRKESVSREWSNSLQMQITEHESLYMDMARTTK